MAERTNIPGSSACGEWETLLADALDGLLGPEEESTFTAHKAVCGACAALYDEARKGREWLEFLAPEPEVPSGLFEKILAATGPGQTSAQDWAGNAMPVPAGSAAIPGFIPPIWQQPGFFVRMRSAMQPRIFMTAAMAFFSIALTLNITGVRLASVHVTPLRLADLRPRNLRAYMERQLNMASVPIVRYYDHIRFVYEVEARVRELTGETEDQPAQEQPRPGETRQVPNGNGGNLHTEPQHSLGPAIAPAIPNNLLQTSLPLNHQHSAVGSAVARAERNALWIA